MHECSPQAQRSRRRKDQDQAADQRRIEEIESELAQQQIHAQRHQHVRRVEQGQPEPRMRAENSVQNRQVDRLKGMRLEVRPDQQLVQTVEEPPWGERA